MIASLQGRHEEARERFGETIRLGREVGDGWMVAIGLNNLGNAERELGAFDAARANYAASLRANEAYDDRWALGHLLEDIGRLAALTGNAADAIRLDGASLALREEIGAPRPPALAAELDAALAAARAALGAEAKPLENEGRNLALAQAVELGHDACRVET